MSTVTVHPGALIGLDASDERVVIFDFDVLGNLATGVVLTSYVISIAPIVQSGLTALTQDSATLMTGSRKVSLRLLATTATLGDRYTVSVKGITNEAPVQQKEYAIDVLIV